ncbi:hypothetical protein GCM10011584_00640 [Nocardioides phosphati]|uniref:YtxH domain-containing protein n=1 Tax=Nocardioides phosphati TaxID=1867775 RepID=A0ABQ2N4A4_9ACTN|nr:hypothetical protein GCM10011584_00640 [Nocardioides phosphati]
MELYAAVEAARPQVQLLATHLRVEQQRGQVVDDEGHGDVVDRCVRDRADRAVGQCAAAEEQQVTGADEACGLVDLEHAASLPACASPRAGCAWWRAGLRRSAPRGAYADGVKVWKWIGLAGIFGIASGGVVIARQERVRRAYTPDEVRSRLHQRLAEAQRGG